MEQNRRVSMRTRVQAKNDLGFGNDNTQLQFVPDYEDGRNKEWATATPALTFSMTVAKSIADMFEVGEKITFYAEATQNEDASSDEKNDGDSGE
jgi:hypothetical protein